MGLFDALRGKSSSNKNYAQLYKQKVEQSDMDGSLDVLKEWGKEPDRFDDSNFLLVMAGLNATTDHPRDDIELYLKKNKIDGRPFDSSVADWYKLFAKTMLMAKGHQDLIDKYL